MPQLDPIIRHAYTVVDRMIEKRLDRYEERVRAIVRDELRRMFESGARATPTPPFIPASRDTGEESEP